MRVVDKQLLLQSRAHPQPGPQEMLLPLPATPTAPRTSTSLVFSDTLLSSLGCLELCGLPSTSSFLRAHSPRMTPDPAA